MGQMLNGLFLSLKAKKTQKEQRPILQYSTHIHIDISLPAYPPQRGGSQAKKQGI